MTVGFTTDVPANCKYATTDIAYGSMTNSMSTGQGTTSHSQVFSVSDGATYDYYFECETTTCGNPSVPPGLHLNWSVAATPSPPVMSNGKVNNQNSGYVFPGGTTSVTVTLNTDVNANCKYDTNDTSYGSMANNFSKGQGTTSHSQTISTSNGTPYTYYIRCDKAAGGAPDTSSLPLSWSVGNVSKRPLGSVTVGSSCSVNSELNNATCQNVTITGCPNLASTTAQLIIATPPTGTPIIGTIVFGSGNYGTTLYAPVGNPRVTMLENLRLAGYRIIERVWTNSVNGWWDGTHGVAVSACRYATLVNWLNSQYPSTPICACGESGGSIEMSFGLSQYNLGNVLTAAVFDSGPFTRLDYYCGGTAIPDWNTECTNIKAAYPFNCGSGSAGCQPYLGAQQIIDKSYGGVATCQGATVGSPVLTTLYNDSAQGPGAIMNFPNTKIEFYEGAIDCSIGIATSGVGYANDITTLGNPPVITVLPGYGHVIAETTSGAAIIQDSLTRLCTTVTVNPPVMSNNRQAVSLDRGQGSD